MALKYLIEGCLAGRKRNIYDFEEMAIVVQAFEATIWLKCMPSLPWHFKEFIRTIHARSYEGLNMLYY